MYIITLSYTNKLFTYRSVPSTYSTTKMYALLNTDLTHVTTAKQIVFYFSYKGGTVVVVIEFTTAFEISVHHH